MQHEQHQIVEFMVKADQATPDRPTVPSREVRVLRVKLIAEELLELCEALGVTVCIDNAGLSPAHCVVTAKEEIQAPEMDTLRDAYDAILDILVVTIGSGVAMGTHLEPGWEEVHRSNMAKFGPGGYKRSDGKWIKPPNWKTPDLMSIIKAQIEAAQAKDNQLSLV